MHTSLKVGIIIIIVVLAVVLGISVVGTNNKNITTSMDTETTETSTASTDTGRVEEVVKRVASSETAVDESQTVSMTATFDTSMGTIVLELFEQDAPKTVENFAKLAQSGFYNGVRFHRVIPGFMIQSGDPLSKDLDDQDYWGTGGPGYKFADEIHAHNNNNIGTIAMANAGPGTNGSQFFINVANNNFLDTKHTVFGKVVQGMDIVNAISQVETEGPDRPVDEVVIKSVVVK